MDARLQGFIVAQLDTTLSEQMRQQWLQSQSVFQHAVVYTGGGWGRAQRAPSLLGTIQAEDRGARR